MSGRPRIAYFSMEIGLHARIPTYSGGLGVLAGDSLRAAADLGLPLAAVTLLYRRGYFRQGLSPAGEQTELPAAWIPERHLEELPARCAVAVEGRTVHLRAWRRTLRGAGGGAVPVYFLDADLPQNAPEDRRLTDQLYGGDTRHRLAQEILLGIGGARMLCALGHDDIEVFHLNEGHAALLAFELLEEELAGGGRDSLTLRDLQAVRRRCVFTTHTPVPYGHDHFPIELARRMIGPHPAFRRPGLFRHEGEFNMTYLALNLSRFVNAVSRRHAEVSRALFPRRPIDCVTNGVHAPTWAAPPFRRLYDRHLPGWREDAALLRNALVIPPAEVARAHERAKRALLAAVARLSGQRLDPEVLTLGFARRATGYKRADLLFEDPARLAAIAERWGGLQLVFAGKAHPRDQEGKEMIRRVHARLAELGGRVRGAWLPGYDMRLGALLTAGADVWLNTPEPPLEASGTSGMKAALNGVPSLSVLDGWWLEGCVEGVTGWAIGDRSPGGGRRAQRARDAASLYELIEGRVARLHREDPAGFLELRRHAIAVNGAWFQTHRMMREYLQKAYFPPPAEEGPPARAPRRRRLSACLS